MHLKGFEKREWTTVTELAGRLQARHHGVVALVCRGETLGLVARKQSTTDLRAVEVRATSRGDKLVAQLVGSAARDELMKLRGISQVPGFKE